MARRTLDDMDLAGKTVLIRADLNVPVENGAVSDRTRIQRIVPTVRDTLAAGARALLLSHFGRPKGQRVESMSLRAVVPALEEELGCAVAFAESPDAAAAEGGVALLENLRFHPGEEANDPDFAAALAAMGDVYCNDAFSASHRAHASTEALARLLPACAGRLMQAELEALEAALGNPRRPLVAVVGGAKVSTKIELLGNLARKADTLVIGGGMANAFLAARGIAIGASLCEPGMEETAQRILGAAEEANCRILLPTDAVVARELAQGAPSETVPVEACPADAMILDAGPLSVAAIAAALDSAATLVWNGPLGAFEVAPFDAATNAAAAHAAGLCRSGSLIAVAGGGDTVAALNRAGAAEGFTYVSTAGGAFLEWMEGRVLPGVAALEAAGTR